jgi:molecular chaperone GrpE
MSQKEESASPDKWRDLDRVDDEHLLDEEAEVPAENNSDKTLTDQLNLLEKQVDFYKDQTARAQAEVENMRRRMEQEVSKARKFGVERLISDMIPVVDGLVRGMEGAVSIDPQVQSMRHGMELTLDIMNKILEKNGIIQIDPLPGDAFDPTQHEAMSMRPDPDAKPNTILQVLQKGYALHGRVIRAAMVIVSA